MDQGFSEMIFGLPPADADTNLPRLDELAKLVEKLRAG